METPSTDPITDIPQDQTETAQITHAAHGAVRLSDLPDVLTVSEAARLLRLGRNAAYEAVAQQLIPSIRIGRRILVPKAALVRLLNGENIPLNGSTM